MEIFVVIAARFMSRYRNQCKRYRIGIWHVYFPMCFTRSVHYHTPYYSVSFVYWQILLVSRDTNFSPQTNSNRNFRIRIYCIFYFRTRLLRSTSVYFIFMCVCVCVLNMRQTERLLPIPNQAIHKTKRYMRYVNIGWHRSGEMRYRQRALWKCHGIIFSGEVLKLALMRQSIQTERHG